MENLRPRVMDRILERRLESFGSVLIEGVKGCGKTQCACRFAESVLNLSNDAVRRESARLSSLAPWLLLRGNAPRLIDEWQHFPSLWNPIRFETDRRNLSGQFILTSSVFCEERTRTMISGPKRIFEAFMRPMSLFESGESTGMVRLSSLFGGIFTQNGFSSLDLEDLAFLVLRGGWPEVCAYKGKQALDVSSGIQNKLIEEFAEADGAARNPDRLRLLLKSYARCQGDASSVDFMIESMKKTDGRALDAKTVRTYLALLKKNYLIEEIPAFVPHLKSKTPVRTSPVRLFTDPSSAAQALSLTPEDLISDLDLFERLFYTLCIRDLRVYAETEGGTILQYRDKNGLSCGAVISMKNGLYALSEITLGGEEEIDKCAEKLKKLASLIDPPHTKTPAFLMVVTGVGDVAYQREDGVCVVPIGCLRD